MNIDLLFGDIKKESTPELQKPIVALFGYMQNSLKIVLK
jgi:hypothetical protein